MNHVDESLYQFEDNKFFKTLFEADILTPAEKSELVSQKDSAKIQKEGMAVVKKLLANWKMFKQTAGDKMQSYRDFWSEQKNADETIGQKGMFYNLYDSNYIVGVVKSATGKAEMKVYNTSDKDTDEFETFVCANKDVMKEFTKFFKVEVEGTMKQVIADHKEALIIKKEADSIKKKEDTATAKKAKLDAFLGESINPKHNYAVVEKGGSIGGPNSDTIPGKGKLVKTFMTNDEAKEYALKRRKGLSKGEKGYYKMSYSAIKITDSIRKSLN